MLLSKSINRLTLINCVNNKSLIIVNNKSIIRSTLKRSLRQSSTTVKSDLPESKDPFLEIEGLSKRKSKARSVFAWGLSATGAIGNTKYFTLGKDKYEKILKPFKIKYFNDKKVITFYILIF